MDNVQEIVDKLNRLRESYYNDSSDMNDELFDFYERKLKLLDPNNPYFDQVGSKINYDTEEIEHEIPMLSMQKVQTLEDAEKWFENIGVDNVWIDPKLDGISGKIVYDSNGNLKYVSTRGDGLIGAIIPFGNKIESVPKKFLSNSELRGEFIIFKKYKNKFNGPLRNACSGILKRKNYTDEVKYISFVIYDVYKYDDEFLFYDRGDKIHEIKTILEDLKQNFNIIPCYKSNNIKEVYETYINRWRNEWEYETDGIIMTVDGNQDIYDSINKKYKITSFNRFNMAVKPPAQFAESEILDIIPTVNRRKVSYVASIKPVYLLDRLISNATLDNYQNIKKNNIGIGTTVLVKSANDVIPKVYNFFNNPNKKIVFKDFTICPVCGSKLVPIYQDLMCPNEFGCKGIYQSKLENIISNFEVKNVGESIIESFTEYLVKTYDKPYRLSNFYDSIIPIGDSYKAENFINEFYNYGKRPQIFKDAIFKFIKENLTDLKILGAFNIPYVSEGALLNHGIKTLNDFIAYIKNLDNDVKLESVFDSTLYTWWNKNKDGKEDLLETFRILKPFINEFKENNGDTISFCISGEVPVEEIDKIFTNVDIKTKSDFIKAVENFNPKFRYVNNVTMDTKILVSNELNTSKVLKANKYNIPVMKFKDFLVLICN